MYGSSASRREQRAPRNPRYAQVPRRFGRWRNTSASLVLALARFEFVPNSPSVVARRLGVSRKSARLWIGELLEHGHLMDADGLLRETGRWDDEAQAALGAEDGRWDRVPAAVLLGQLPPARVFAAAVLMEEAERARTFVRSDQERAQIAGVSRETILQARKDMIAAGYLRAGLTVRKGAHGPLRLQRVVAAPGWKRRGAAFSMGLMRAARAVRNSAQGAGKVAPDWIREVEPQPTTEVEPHRQPPTLPTEGEVPQTTEGSSLSRGGVVGTTKPSPDDAAARAGGPTPAGPAPGTGERNDSASTVVQKLVARFERSAESRRARRDSARSSPDGSREAVAALFGNRAVRLLSFLEVERDAESKVRELLRAVGCYSKKPGSRRGAAASLVVAHGLEAPRIIATSIANIAADPKVSQVGAVLAARIGKLCSKDWRDTLSGGRPLTIPEAIAAFNTAQAPSPGEEIRNGTARGEPQGWADHLDADARSRMRARWLAGARPEELAAEFVVPVQLLNEVIARSA